MGERQTNIIHTLTPYVPAVGCFVASLFEPWGKQSAVLLVSLGIVLLIAAVTVQRKRYSQDKHDDTDDMIACMNIKRHDWLNHIQVMKGYLSLNKHDRLQSYLNHVLNEVEQESCICHLGYTPLSRYLLTHNMLAKDILLDIHIMHGLKVENDRQGERLLNTIKEVEHFLHHTCGTLLGEPLKIGITLAPHEKDIMLYVDLPEQPLLSDELRQADWTAFSKKVSSWNGEVFIERDELAMECTVRIS